MKLSNTPTNYIAVKAMTNSDSMDPDFGFIELNPAYYNTLEIRAEAVNHLKADSSFYCMEFWDQNISFLIINEEKITENQLANLSLIEDQLNTESWVFIEMEEGDNLELFNKPEEKLDTFTMKMKPAGNFCFTAYGKNSGNEFWTEDIDFSKLSLIL